MTDKARMAFVERYSEEMHRIGSELEAAVWDMETTSAETAKERMVQLEIDFHQIFQRSEDWQTIRDYYYDRDAIVDGDLRRQIERLYYNFAANQDRPDRVATLARLAADVQGDFTSFRASFEGREVNDNDLNAILREETDSATVRAAWESSKSIGPVVAERIVRLAELRNEAAQDLGYRDYYAQSLHLQEIEEAHLFDLFEDLEVQTRGPFAQLKAELDQGLAQRFGVSVGALRPWHYANPFFQEPPPLSGVSLDPVFEGKDVAMLAVDAFDRMGMEVRDIIERSDLYERPGKNQHAFCIHIDALSDDVRVLCNLRSDEFWTTTMLHELGHGVYDKYLDPELPYLLRGPAHTSSTEAIAMLMGRLTHHPGWLSAVAGADDVASLTEAANRDLAFQMLTFVRWVLVMTHFERALYQEPRRPDLNGLWWELVGRFQMLTIPEGRRHGETPDWAAKIHLALYPVYYHNYLLGELTASQIQHTLSSHQDGDSWFLQPATGGLLRKRLFALGAKHPWNETLELVTDEPLRTDYFASQFVEVSS